MSDVSSMVASWNACASCPGISSSRGLGIEREGGGEKKMGEMEGARRAVRVRAKVSVSSLSTCSVSSTSTNSYLVLSKYLCKLLFLVLFFPVCLTCVFVRATSLSDILHESEMRCRIERC